MKKSIVVFVVIASLLVIGIRACYLKDYNTVLKFPEDSSKFYISPDSISIAPWFFVEDANTLGAIVNFEVVPDSLVIESLEVNVSSSDHPNQSIRLKKVTTTVHPVTTGNGNLEWLEAKSFNELPLHSKTITNSGLPYNKIIFYFKTSAIRKTDFYTFSIKGKFIYKGQAYNFVKEVVTERKVEYHPYRMMT